MRDDARPTNLEAIPPSRVPKYLWALFLALIRAKILKDEFDKSRCRFDRVASQERAAGQRPDHSEFYRVLTFLEVWLASLQVVVEGYDDSHKHSDSLLSDPSVDVLLDEEHRQALRRFRNSVFHVRQRDHPSVTAVLARYEEFRDWGTGLMKELGRVIIEHATGKRAR